MKNIGYLGFLTLLAVISLTVFGGLTNAQSVPDSSNSGNMVASPAPVSSGSDNASTGGPGASNSSNVSSGVPASSNTGNVTSGVPGSSNTSNVTGGVPDSSNSDNTTGGVPGSSNTDNASGGGVPASSNTSNTTSSGGSGTIPATYNVIVPGGGGGNGPLMSLPSGVSGSAMGGAPIQTIVPVCAPYINEYMKLGVKNNPAEVLKLQTFLRDYEKLDVDVNGIYDNKTFEAVKAFQLRYVEDVLKKSWGISTPTGGLFITTRTKINDIYCKTSTDFTTLVLPRVTRDATTENPVPPLNSSEIKMPLPGEEPETINESEIGLGEGDNDGEENVAAVAKSVPSRFASFIKSIWQSIFGKGEEVEENVEE